MTTTPPYTPVAPAPQRTYRLLRCVQDRHSECPEYGPPGSADVPGMSCEADMCECPCHVLASAVSDDRHSDGPAPEESC